MRMIGWTEYKIGYEVCEAEIGRSRRQCGRLFILCQLRAQRPRGCSAGLSNLHPHIWVHIVLFIHYSYLRLIHRSLLDWITIESHLRSAILRVTK